MSKRVCLSALLAVAVACGGGNNNPSPTAPTPAVVRPLSDFVTGLQSLDGLRATRTSGARPTANGGPAVTATAQGASSNAATPGGSSLVRLSAGAPFSAVLLHVTDSPDEFYTLTLPAATRDAYFIVAFARAIPNAVFQTTFSVSAPDGQVGAPSSIVNTVAPAATSAKLELAFHPNPVQSEPLLIPAFPSGVKWPYRITLRETNGIGLTITKNTFQMTLAGACSPNPSCPVGSGDFVAFFTECGHSGARIEANGLACSTGLYGASTAPVGGGFIEYTFSGTDDRGNAVSVAGRVTFTPP
ncbi:MAG: hypothetical protein AAB654_19675 [Acidobacteriota bacterium]